MESRRRGSPVLAALGVALAAAGGVLAVADRGRAPAPSGATAEQIAAAVEGRLTVARAAIGERARTLAELPLLASAVATDQATVRDLTQNEIGFRPRAGEEIEIAQVDLATGTVAVLLRLPDGTPPRLRLDAAGQHVDVDPARAALIASDVRTVTPSDPNRAREVGGVLAVGATVDLAPVVALLAGGGARVEVAGKVLVLGAPLADQAATVVATVPGAATVKVEVARPRPVARGLVAVARGPALALLGLALLAIGLVRRRREADPAPVPVAAPVEVSGADRFGRYQTLKLIGSGGMADVYLARATGEAGFERTVALKVLHPHLARNASAVNHFLDEARLASRLTHPSIVQVLDLGKTGTDYFIAMELVDGADLDRLLRAARDRGEQVPLPIAMTILRRVCDGLHAAYTALGADGTPLGLIHRDVKTANVLLSKTGAVKIGDFGIARAATTVRTTTIGETKGTAEVMPPEQRMGQEIDVRADVYATAALGYELMTAATVNLDLAVLAKFGIEGWPHLPPPSQLRPELPVALDAVLIGALAYDPANRPPSCAALEEQLAAIAHRHRLSADDKEIAAWLAIQLPQLPVEELDRIDVEVESVARPS